MNKIKTFKIFSSILLSSGGVAAAVCSPSITTHFKQKNYFAISEKDNVKETLCQTKQRAQRQYPN